MTGEMARQRGFILAATLWFLAVSTLALGFYALWMERALSLAGAMQDDMQAQIEMQGTQATLLYLLATQRMTLAGLTVPDPPPEKSAEEMLLRPKVIEEDEMPSLYALGNEIRLDDRVYQGYGNALFAVQDERGLVNVNFSRDALSRLLGLLGVAGELRGPLLDKLDDYIDADDLHRLNGAERQHYRERGLPPPSDRLLLSPLEAMKILDWPQQAGLWEAQAWARLTTIAPYSGLPNFNTAPLLVLQSFDFIGAEEAARIVAAREGQPLLHEAQLYAVIGKNLGLDEMETNFLPSEYLRLSLWHPQAKILRQTHLHVTPFVDKQMPWQIEYTLHLPLDPAYQQTPAHAPSVLFSATLPPAAR